MVNTKFAPIFPLPERDIVAIEHPMVVKNIDTGLKTFGKLCSFKAMISKDEQGSSLPLYLRPTDRTCAPILSHNSATDNVLLKIIVPKRTGRKRKRGSQEPYSSHPPEDTAIGDLAPLSNQNSLRSQSRFDHPKDLLRTLKDNKETYHVEAVGTIRQTHRYRSISDFHMAPTGPFMTKVQESLLDGELSSLKQFSFNYSRGIVPNDEIIAPPVLTDKNIPFNWSYSQNPQINVTLDPSTGVKTLKNRAKSKIVKTAYLSQDIPLIPTSAPNLPPADPNLQRACNLLKKALDERPIWTRRSLGNHTGMDLSTIHHCIQHVGYQFRAGPWRDAVIRFGLDPRLDPTMRQYQTVVFKIHEHDKTSRGTDGQPWVENRSDYVRKSDNRNRQSHCFDGQSLALDGKIWQLIDVTDPLLRRLIDTPNLRTTCDDTDGWYLNGTMAKIKAIMRTKLSAIRIGRKMRDEEFEKTMAVPDDLPGKRRTASVPVPDWKIDANEAVEMGIDPIATVGAIRKRRVKGSRQKTGKEGMKFKKLSPNWKAPLEIAGQADGEVESESGEAGGDGDGDEDGPQAFTPEDLTNIDPRILDVDASMDGESSTRAEMQSHTRPQLQTRMQMYDPAVDEPEDGESSAEEDEGEDEDGEDMGVEDVEDEDEIGEDEDDNEDSMQEDDDEVDEDGEDFDVDEDDDIVDNGEGDEDEVEDPEGDSDGASVQDMNVHHRSMQMAVDVDNDSEMDNDSAGYDIETVADRH